ncbi:MAG: response regulator [Elusimicrobia bacterium]|nr:response regulator [Elusimicrobiota bacterium]
MTQSEDPSKKIKALSRDEPAAGRLPCVMVVDDDGAIRLMLRTALEKQYAVVCLSNGEDVLSAIETHSPKLLLLDINLPGSDGYEICAKVRDRAKMKKLPILFMTVSKDDASFLKSLAAGGDALICKPFEMVDLREKIEYLLGRYA